jgi:flagellar hook-associated protein FlgK
MSNILTIGSSAIEAYQRALGTVSNNIANLNTDGYSHQDVSLAPSTPANRGNIYLGTGVVVTGVKRAYSEFAVNSLRNSFSALNTQEPLVQYSNRIIDVMGSTKSGLSSALDQFFSSARDVSAAPASADMRGQFLSSADGVAARLRELASQLYGVETDSRKEIQAGLERINTITAQLGVVNSQLRRNGDSAEQSPVLLDQRDLLLNELSKIAGISVTSSANGEVTVGLGSTAGQSIILQGSTASPVGAAFSDGSAGKVDIIIDPYGAARNVNNLDSGSIVGLIAFRQQALEPAQSRLDTLAQVFANEVNKIQASGIDGHGQVGKPLFAIAPVFQIESAENHAEVSVEAVVVDPAATAHRDIALSYDERKHVWTAIDAVGRTSAQSAAGASELTINGVRLTFSAVPQGAIALNLKAFQRPASTIRLTQTDPMGIAAGALFRVTPGPGNTGARAAVVTFDPAPASDGGPARLDRVFANNPNAAAGVAFRNPPAAPAQGVAVVPAGFGNVQLQLSAPPDGNLNLQVLTRDGRQLLGTPLSADQQQSLLKTQNGFTAGAGYSSQYLNASGDAAYRDLDLFYGASALPGGNAAFDRANNIVDLRSLPARIDAAAMPAPVGAPGSTYIAANALSLNGSPLDALRIPDDGHLQASDLASWINSQTPAGSGVSASASTSLRIDPAQLLTARTNHALSINGTAIYGDADGVFASVHSLATAINDASAGTGVRAVVEADGAIVLSNGAGRDGEDIVLDTPTVNSANVPTAYGNVLGLDPLHAATVHGRLALSSATQIRLGIGPAGGAADLAKLGLRASVRINGVIPEDLLVFQSGIGTGSVAAGYEPGSVDTLSAQRAQPLLVRFTSPGSYAISDAHTGQVLAERSYDAAAGIRYGTLTLQLSGAPAVGDRYLIDGNNDGTGNNENILRIAALETQGLMPQSKTLGEAYNAVLTDIGSVSSQASIAQQAMTVVNQQAIEARDKISGVNLDKEAADLIRFQQAYQAAAKTIQIANELFDSIAQIR